jgi:hypothetical protein
MSQFHTNELVEEARKKRVLTSMKPTGLPENHNNINNEKPESHNNGNNHLPESHKNSSTVKQEENNSVKGEHSEDLKNQSTGKSTLPENRNTIKKVKVTVYITEEAWEDFNTIYGKRILDKRKTDKGDLMTEAIELLKQKENTRIP